MKLNSNNKNKNRLRTLLISIFLIVTASAMSASAATVSTGNFDVASGGSVNGTLMVNDAADFWGADVTISYDPSVVIITNVKPTNPFISITSNINNATGSTKIIADGPLTGLSGDIFLSNITFKAVGTAGSSRALNITVNQMIDIYGNDIPATPINGKFNITGSNLKYIIITPSATTTLTVGQTQNFNSTALDENNNPMTGIDISWTVSNSAVGTVIPIKSITDVSGNASTTFNASAPGNTMVNATNGSVTGTAIVTVERVAPFLNMIEVSPSTKTLIVGDNFTFLASPKDQYGDAFSASVVWSSSNNTVGSVDASGKFTASNPGTAMVNATNGSVTGTAIVTVERVTPFLNSINVTPSPVTLLVGDNQTFTATPKDQYGDAFSLSVTWSSSNNTVGSVDASGKFTASNPGTAMVNATNGSVTGTAIVTVERVPPFLNQIEVSPTTKTLIVEDNFTFTAFPKDQYGNPFIASVTWSSSNSTVGTVDALGKFIASSPGTAIVNATNSSVTGTAIVTVERVAPLLNQIEVSPTTKTLIVGDIFIFTATPKDQYNDAFPATVTWTSSNLTVGTVDASGKFIASNPGTAMVNATNGSVTGTAIVTVERVAPFLNQIEVSPTTKTLTVGDNFTFLASSKDQYGDAFSVSVIWSSSNNTVGTVDASGKFIASNPGFAMVNATNGSVTGTAIVTVVKVPSFLNSIVVSPTTKTLIVGDNQTFTVTPKDQYDNAFPATVTWTSSNHTVGTIDASGKFIASNPGTAMVNATNGSVTGTAIVTVETVSPSPTPVLTTIAVTPSTVALTVGEIQEFIATAKDQNGNPMPDINISWTSSNLTVGGISSSNGITGPDGNATITFSAAIPGTANLRAQNGSVNDSASVTVNPLSVLTSSISGYKIKDTNGNGKWDEGEAGIQGWEITLKNVTTGEVIASNLTGTNGYYIFTNLANGSYNVSEEIRTGFTPTNATFKLVNLDGQNVMNLNFTNQLLEPVESDLIKNPGFESGTSPWIFYTNGTGKFTTASPGFEESKSANIVVYTSATNIQLYQTGVSLEPKTRYRLSFAAYSKTGHDLRVQLIKHVSPYTGYGLGQTFNLGTNWQEFSTEFTTTGFTGTVNDGRLMFWLAPFATAGDTYYIDNVRLEKITGTLSVTTTPVSGDIYVDSVKKGTGSWNGLVSAGIHTVSFGPVSGYSTPSLQKVEVLKDQTIQVTGTYEASGNLVINPGFESGTLPWIFYTNGNGKFTASSPGYEGNNSANIILYTGGTNIQLYQTWIFLEPKTRYRLSFAAYSTTGHDIRVQLIKHASPYTGYGLGQTFNLGTSWQEFSTEFTTTGFTGTVNDGRLMFYVAPFATAGDTYYIDDVRLSEI